MANHPTNTTPNRKAGLDKFYSQCSLSMLNFSDTHSLPCQKRKENICKSRIKLIKQLKSHSEFQILWTVAYQQYFDNVYISDNIKTNLLNGQQLPLGNQKFPV